MLLDQEEFPGYTVQKLNLETKKVHTHLVANKGLFKYVYHHSFKFLDRNHLNKLLSSISLTGMLKDGAST